MTFTTNLLDFLCGLIELSAIVICLDLFGIYNINTIAKRRFIFALIVYVGVSIGKFFLIDVHGDPIGFLMTILYIAKIFLPLFLILGSINLKIGYIAILIETIVSFLSESTTCIISNVLETVSVNFFSVVNTCIQVFICVLLLFFKKKTDTKKVVITLKIIPKSVFALLLLTVLCLSALVSLISFDTDDLKTKESLLIAIIIALSIILACIVVSLILNVIAKQYFTVTSQMMEKQVELQINHHKELEKMDAEMRKFRHDYTNHLQSILSLIHMKEYSQAEEYIEKLQKAKHKSDTISFYSGNQLADALLANKCAALSEGFRIDYSGIIPSSIENTDLCVILSNSLDNAVEACENVPAPGVISVFAGKQQGYFVMSIKNPTSCRDNFYEIPTTTKSDKGQHGMGLYNIESVVKKYNGQMKIKCENGIFELVITMKL